LVDLIRGLAHVNRGALKKLHPPESQMNSEVASERMKREIAALQSIEHPAVPRILEANLDELWFVMEFYSGGALNRDLTRTKGKVLETLQRLRPVVEAASLLHAKGLVHRDIKPKNIFVREGGDLVLGDLGLVIAVGGQDPRVTEVYDNPGSRDWMPGWVLGKTRIEDVRSSVDVFALGKVL
jgi:eukaryotic-like serine/threonine-protein kinase